MAMLRKTLGLISKIFFNVMVVIFGFAMLFTVLCSDQQIEDLLSQYAFGEGETEIINTGKAPIWYKTWYSGVEDVLNGNGAIAAAAQAEGSVLLKNDVVDSQTGEKALPLASGTRVDLYGDVAYNPMYSLDGAGEVKINTSAGSTSSRQQFYADEFEKVGLDVNDNLQSWYNDNLDTYGWDSTIDIDGNGGSNGQNTIINGASWGDIPSNVKDTGSGATAIFIVGRMTNEAIDLPPLVTNGNSGTTDNDYLKFTSREESILQNLNANYERVILIFNQANPPQEDLPELLSRYGVDAAMWIGFPGSDGIAAVADLLVGNSNPSGGLSDMWYTSRNANPSTLTYGNNNNVVMQEGIYIGYRYAETRYEDVVLGSPNAGTYSYDSQVSYPFGYGLSYTDFSYVLGDPDNSGIQPVTGVSADEDLAKNHYKNDLEEELRPESERRVNDGTAGGSDDIRMTVTVTNTGSVAGKKNVQVYLQKPYTDNANIEKPAVELVGFDKTSKLESGESETLTIEIDANKMFASYDRTAYDGAGGYILEAGDYLLTVASNSHEAVNNFLLYKQARGTDMTEASMDSEYGAGSASLVSAVTVSAERAENYKYWTNGSEQPKNLFDHIDPNVSGDSGSHVTYMSRSDWNGTAGISDDYNNLSVTGGMSGYRALNGASSINDSTAKQYYPHIDLNTPDPEFAESSASGDDVTMLIEMKGVEYDPNRGASAEDIEAWESFMEQLTWEETAGVISSGLRRTIAVDSVGKPYTNDVNASNAISWQFNMSLNGGGGTSNVGFAYRFDSGNRHYYPTGYPCEGVIASSFNIDVAYAVGQAIGEDGLWTGASGLYGFGLGLHRNPYHGRTGEYYSEDPYLTGVIGGYSSLGAQSKGLYVYNKHFVLNDQETNRTGYRTWLSEQTFREVYLRPFEIAIEIGDAMNVMNSFNNVGNGWSGNDYNLMTAWLRGEAGMAGFAVTDYWRSGGMNLTYGLIAGTDLPDGSTSEVQNNWTPGTGRGYYAAAARQAAMRIMYTVVNSNAMNFIGEDTQIITHDPAWFAVRDGIVTAAVVLFVVSAVFAAGMIVWNLLEERRERLKTIK